MFRLLIKGESPRSGTSALRPLAVQGRQSNPFYTPGAELFCQGNFKGCLHNNSFLYLLVKSRQSRAPKIVCTVKVPITWVQLFTRARAKIPCRDKRKSGEERDTFGARGGRHEIMVLFQSSLLSSVHLFAGSCVRVWGPRSNVGISLRRSAVLQNGLCDCLIS